MAAAKPDNQALYLKRLLAVLTGILILGIIDAMYVARKESGLPSLLWIAAYPASYTIVFTGAVVLSLFLMASGNLIYEKLLRLMPTLTDKKNAMRIVHDVEREVSVYLLTLTGINAGVGVAIGVSYYLIGMPTAYLWGFLGFGLNFIPYAGPLAGQRFRG